MPRYVFAIENNVGNATYRKNLEGTIGRTEGIVADFLPIDLVARDVWALVPGVRGNLALVASARAASALYAAKLQSQVDAALIHSQSIGLFAVEFMRKVPTIISTDATPAAFDTLNEGYGQSSRNKLVEEFKNAWTHWTFRSARLLLAWSEWVKNSFINDYNAPPEKVATLHPGLDVELWKPDPALKKNDGIVRILFSSGDFKRKGGDLLVKWIQNTKHKTNVEIHMASKEKVPEIPGIVPHYGLTANSNGLVQLAQSCDLFALPTRADCSPWAVVEAQAVGLAGVSTRVGAIHELVEDGVTGLLAPAGDEAGVFDRLDKLVEDEGLRKKMSEAARARVIEHFDVRKNSNRLLDLFKQIL